LTDAATGMKEVECETENAKLLKDENAKMNRSVERLRNDFDENSLSQNTTANYKYCKATTNRSSK